MNSLYVVKHLSQTKTPKAKGNTQLHPKRKMSQLGVNVVHMH